MSTGAEIVKCFQYGSSSRSAGWLTGAIMQRYRGLDRVAHPFDPEGCAC